MSSLPEAGPEKFGRFIEKMRRSQRWSQHQLGQKVDARSSYVTSVENGETWPSDHFIDRCAELFGVPHQYLYAMLGQRRGIVAENQKIV